jgi:methylmalonyl-CoA mutase cobalamin-binding subunit
MKGARFADVAAIQERVTAVLRSILTEAFADSFQMLYERCQQCVVKDGDYFAGDEVFLYLLFCRFSGTIHRTF